MTRRVVRVEGIVPVARGYPAAVVAHGLVFVGGLRGGRTDRDQRFADLPSAFRSKGFSGFPDRRSGRSRLRGGRLGRA